MLEEHLESAEQAVKEFEDVAETQETQEEIQEDVREEVPQESLEEQYARQKGWKPKEEWDESRGEWIDAAEFNRRGPLFETIGKLKDEIRGYKKSADSLAEHNRMLAEKAKEAEERGRQKAIEELEQQRLEAVRDGDLEAFQDAENRIKEYEPKEEPKIEEQKTEEPKLDPEVQSWVDKNTWFEKDEAMTLYMIEQQKKNLSKGLSLSEALKLSEEQVKREFAHKFTNPNKDKPSPMAGKVDSGTKKSYSINDLPPQYRPIYKEISRNIEMPLSEYIDQLKDMGVL